MDIIKLLLQFWSQMNIVRLSFIVLINIMAAFWLFGCLQPDRYSPIGIHALIVVGLVWLATELYSARLAWRAINAMYEDEDYLAAIGADRGFGWCSEGDYDVDKLNLSPDDFRGENDAE